MSDSYVSVMVSVDWRLNGSNEHTFSVVYNLKEDYSLSGIVGKHFGNLIERLRYLGVSESSVEVFNARVDRV